MRKIVEVVRAIWREKYWRQVARLYTAVPMVAMTLTSLFCEVIGTRAPGVTTSGIVGLILLTGLVYAVGIAILITLLELNHRRLQ